eukprot:10861411-Alexandrium_andersonii.AAC.1
MPTGGFTLQASDPLPDLWAGASWGQGWADSTHGQGRPQEDSVDLHAWSDSCSAVDLEAQPQGYRLW